MDLWQVDLDGLAHEDLSMLHDEIRLYERVPYRDLTYIATRPCEVPDASPDDLRFPRCPLAVQVGAVARAAVPRPMQPDPASHRASVSHRLRRERERIVRLRWVSSDKPRSSRTGRGRVWRPHLRRMPPLPRTPLRDLRAERTWPIDSKMTTRPRGIHRNRPHRPHPSPWHVLRLLGEALRRRPTAGRHAVLALALDPETWGYPGIPARRRPRRRGMASRTPRRPAPTWVPSAPGRCCSASTCAAQSDARLTLTEQSKFLERALDPAGPRPVLRDRRGLDGKGICSGATGTSEDVCVRGRAPRPPGSHAPRRRLPKRPRLLGAQVREPKD